MIRHVIVIWPGARPRVMSWSSYCLLPPLALVGTRVRLVGVGS